jgi:hypothetical protein
VALLAALFARVSFLLVIAACSLREPVSPVKPAEPLPADPPVTLDTMQVECDALLAALATYKECPHHERNDVEKVEAWIEAANRNLDAGKKANPEPNAQKAIAGACHRAAVSVKAANDRCLAGPPRNPDEI